MTRTADIERLLREGRRLRAQLLDVRRLDSELGQIRVAIVVPKFGFTVVRRNRLKRRLRELTRLHILPQAPSCDLIIRARPEAYQAPFGKLRDEIRVVADRLV